MYITPENTDDGWFGFHQNNQYSQPKSKSPSPTNIDGIKI